MPEAQPISLTDLVTDELEVKPEKLIAATKISNEAIEDTDPAAAELLAQSIARTLADKVDAMVFGSVPAPAPAGLGRLAAGCTNVGATDVKDLDAWHAGIAAVRNAGGTPSAILVGTGTALRLTTTKESGATTARRNLLQPDPTSPTTYAIGGIKIVVSRHIPDTVSYVVDGTRLRLVILKRASLEVDRSVFALTRESLVLGEARVGFGSLHDEAVARIVVNP